MHRLEDFRIWYNNTIHPELRRLERRRQRLLWLLLGSSILLIALLIFALVLQILVFFLFILIPISLYISYLLYRIRRFIRTFKPQVVNLILDFIDDGVNYGTLHYKPKEKIPKKTFDKSGIFVSPADQYLGEDFIYGQIGELNFEMSELNVREFSKVRSRLDYVFRGIFLHTQFHSSVQGRILVLPRDFRQYLSRSIRAISQNRGQNIDNLIRDKAFREHFMTYATKDARLRYFLTNELQNALVEFFEETGKHLYLSFINDKLYLAVTEHKNILEPYLFRTNVSFELVREFFEDIQLMLNIVEMIDQNQ